MKPTKRALLNLLAVIHRDGGHYTERHGIEKSATDAEAKVFKLLYIADSVHESFDAEQHQTLLGYDRLGDPIFGTDPEARAKHNEKCK